MNSARSEAKKKLNQELIEAIGACDVKQVELLIRQGADVNAESIHQPGMSALRMACDRGEWKIAEMLLDYGADIYKKCKNGITPLKVAMSGMTFSKPTPTHVLLEFMSKSTNPQKDINDTDIKQWRPIQLAIAMGNFEVAEAFLALGADIHLRSTEDETAMTCVARSGMPWENQEESIQWLVDHGADLFEKDNAGKTFFDHVTHPGILNKFEEKYAEMRKDKTVKAAQATDKKISRMKLIVRK